MADLRVSISPAGMVGLEQEKVSAQLANKRVETDPAQQVSKTAETEKQDEEIKAAEAKPEQEKKEAAAEEVEEAVEEVNAFMQSMQRNLSFRVDDQLGQEIISVTDAETNEVIRQIPSEELVVLRKKMDDVVGILFDTKV